MLMWHMPHCESTIKCGVVLCYMCVCLTLCLDLLTLLQVPYTRHSSDSTGLLALDAGCSFW